MNNSLFNKKIPTVFALIVIAIGVTFISYLVNTGVIFIGRASPGHTPENIRISNITDTSFSISYTTTDPALGSIAFGISKNLGMVVLDNRDQQSGNVTQHYMHYITVQNLTPSTKYFYTITSGTVTFQNDSIPFEIITAAKSTTALSSQTPLVGKVIEEDGTIPKEAVVYLTTAKAQVASALVKADGTYIVPLNALYDDQLLFYVTFTPETILQLLVTSVSKQSTVVLLAKQINPVPPITLSQNYDFTVKTTPIASASAQLIGFPSFSASPVGSGEAKIITPKKEESFTDQQPLFKGTALPGSSVKITIHSPETIEAQVQSDSKGTWAYRPTKPLSPGKHTISITAKNASGIVKTITQTFTVYAAGTQIDLPGSSSLSPTPTTTPPLKSTPTPTPLPLSTPTPTIVVVTLTPTPPPPTPTQIPLIATPLPTKPPTTKGQLPPPGNSSFLGIGIPAFITTGIGIVLFLLSRGGIPL